MTARCAPGVKSFPGTGALAMPLLSLKERLGAAALLARLFARYGFWRPGLVVIPHLIALTIMVATEFALTAMAAFLFAWGILNFFWLTLLRRPAVAATLSLTMMTVLVLLSQLKYHVLMMTANFVDLMIVDTDTVTFLFTIFPTLRCGTEYDRPGPCPGIRVAV
jgi:hypothetical protein